MLLSGRKDGRKAPNAFHIFLILNEVNILVFQKLNRFEKYTHRRKKKTN